MTIPKHRIIIKPIKRKLKDKPAEMPKPPIKGGDVD